MEELLKKWKEWKESPKGCTCTFKEGKFTDLSEDVIVIHIGSCPMADNVRTDVGMFINWLESSSLHQTREETS